MLQPGEDTVMFVGFQIIELGNKVLLVVSQSLRELGFDGDILITCLTAGESDTLIAHSKDGIRFCAGGDY